MMSRPDRLSPWRALFLLACCSGLPGCVHFALGIPSDMTPEKAIEIIKSCDKDYFELPFMATTPHGPDHLMEITHVGEDGFTVQHTMSAHETLLVSDDGVRRTFTLTPVSARSWDETYRYADLPEIQVVWMPCSVLFRPT